MTAADFFVTAFLGFFVWLLLMLMLATDTASLVLVLV